MKIQLILKDKNIYSEESISLLSIVNVAYVLATIETIQNHDKNKFQFLEKDYKNYLEEANIKERQIRKNITDKLNFNIRKFDYREGGRYDEMLHELNKKEINELYEIHDNKVNAEPIFPFRFLRSRYFAEYQKEVLEIIREYNKKREKLFLETLRRNSDYTLAAFEEYSFKINSILKSEFKISFSNTRIKFKDFYDWAKYINNDKITEIEFASSANSLEYLVSTIIIFSFDNYSLTKDIVKLTYLNIKNLLKTRNEKGVPKPERTYANNIELSPALLRTISKYDEVDLDYDLKEEKIKIKLKR